MQQGALLPQYHKAYWLGLSAGPVWSEVTWIDGDISGSGGSTWTHWGQRRPEDLDPWSANCTGAFRISSCALSCGNQRVHAYAASLAR